MRVPQQTEKNTLPSTPSYSSTPRLSLARYVFFPLKSLIMMRSLIPILIAIFISHSSLLAEDHEAWTYRHFDVKESDGRLMALG